MRGAGGSASGLVVSNVRIVLFTRYPEPGLAKTRLIPALGPDGAAALHRRLTERTLAQVRASGLPFEVRTTGGSSALFAAWLGDTPMADQGAGDLGARMKRAAPPYPAIFIGADAPDISAGHLLAAAAALRRHAGVVGPAEDGGYWLLGLARPLDALFQDMPWGTKHVLPKTLSRFREAGVEPGMMPLLADLDRPEDLRRWPDLAGNTFRGR